MLANGKKIHLSRKGCISRRGPRHPADPALQGDNQPLANAEKGRKKKTPSSEGGKKVCKGSSLREENF